MKQELRQLVATWMAPAKAGDIETVLSLMAEDVVFLMPRQSPMEEQPGRSLLRVLIVEDLIPA
jgi:ketosteroid isomerase-like protein